MGLTCNVPAIFNETLANFSHLQRLRTLQFESPSRYTSFTLAGVEGAQNSFRRLDMFWNLTRLDDLRVNIILTRFNWDAIGYLSNLRVLDVSYTQMDESTLGLSGLFSAIQKYRPPLENLTMKGVQRIGTNVGLVSLNYGILKIGNICRSLQNSPLKILDLLENQAIALEPRLSVYLPQLEILRVGSNRHIGWTSDDPESLSSTCVFIDLLHVLIHPSIREYTYHFADRSTNAPRGRRDLLGAFFENPLRVLKQLQNCRINSSGISVCDLVNCMCEDFPTFPCELFHGWQMADLLGQQERECYGQLLVPLPPCLKSLIIRNMIGTTHSSFGTICINPSNNLTYFDISNGKLKGYFLKIVGFKGLKKLKYFNIQNNGILLTQKMSLFADMPSLEVLLLGHNSIRLGVPEKMDFLQASTLRSLDVQGYNLMSMPHNSLQRLRNLENLNVSENGLEYFNVNITALKYLRHLNLSNNLLKNLGEEIRQSLDVLAETNSITLDLSLNPLECSCNDASFTRWLKTTKASLARPRITTCIYPARGKVSIQEIDLQQFHRICIRFEVIISSIFSRLGVVSVIGVGFLIYKRRWRLRYWMHILNEALRQKQATEMYNELDGNFVYDAFVAYSSHGEERPWVHTTLREKLEGEHGLKLCMYHRDFKVGRDLADIIVEGINRSSKILLILSPTFLNSCWCEFEVRMANEKVVKERRDAVILVVYSRLDQAGVRLPRKLAKLLEKRIYIEWTEDPDGQKLFWSRLLQSMKKDERYDAFGDLCEISAAH